MIHLGGPLVERNMKWFRGGLVFKAHGPLYHSTLGSRVIKREERSRQSRPDSGLVLSNFGGESLQNLSCSLIFGGGSGTLETVKGSDPSPLFLISWNLRNRSIKPSFHRTHSSFSLRQSTPTQSCQLIVLYYFSKQQFDDFVGGLTF